MTETGFGGGGYVYTQAALPTAPLVEHDTAESVSCSIGPDTNPQHTEYAIQNTTDGTYVDSDGSSSVSEVWQTRNEWGTITVTGLAPSETYSFRTKARNRNGVETAFGMSAEISTYNAMIDTCPIVFSVSKTSSTILTPPFLKPTGVRVRIDGKELSELGIVINSISGVEPPAIVPDDELIPGDHTWVFWDEYFSPKQIIIEGHIHGTSADDLHLRLAYLKSYLATFRGIPWRSCAPVRFERSDIPGRYWMAYYERLDHIEPVGTANSSSARIRMFLKCPKPFAADNETTRIEYTPEVNSFQLIELGNAPADATYVLSGPAEDPAFTIGDMVFLCDFENGLSFTDVTGESLIGSCTPPESETMKYRTTETGTGFSVSGSMTLSFDCPGNPCDGAWIAAIAPEWQSTARLTDAVILEHYADDDNYIRLFWNSTAHTWVFRKRTGGQVFDATSSPQAFTAGTRISLGIVYDNSNAGGMKLFVNGAQEGIHTDIAPLEQTPTQLSFHAEDGSLTPDCVFDMVAGWSRMLSADEMRRITIDPTNISNTNATIRASVTLDSGDLLTLDSRYQTAVLFDRSESTRTTALANISGTIPLLTPGRKRNNSDRTQTMLYTETAISAFEIRYIRHYL